LPDFSLRERVVTLERRAATAQFDDASSQCEAREWSGNTNTLGNTMNHVSPLSPATLVVRSDGFVEAEIENEVVALNIEKGTCYGLNLVGSRVWRLLADPIRIGDICARLLGEYKVEPNVCERQVLDLLEELRAEGLIATPKET
jgi:hypothetical protein